MKCCPQCNRTYSDETFSFCLADGALLSARYKNLEETQFVQIPSSPALLPTEVLPLNTGGRISNAKEDNVNRRVLFCRSKDTIAKGEFNSSSFTVFTGSECNLTEAKSVGRNIANLRRTLIKDGTLLRHGKGYRFTRDYIFSSPSTAAGVVLGRQANGWVEWKYTDGKTLDEVKRPVGANLSIVSAQPKTSIKNHSSSRIKIKIKGQTFDEPTLPKLYVQVLKFLYEGNYLSRLEIPMATGSRRYLLAREPRHPRGNKFIAPVEYNGYYMESNKPRDGGIRDLAKLLTACRLTMQIIE